MTAKTPQYQIYQTASAMLDGSMNYLAGAIEIEHLRHDIGAYENDPAFMPFIAILAEVDELGIGRDPSKWRKAVANATAPAIAEAIVWAKDLSLLECQSLVKRYKSATKP